MHFLFAQLSSDISDTVLLTLVRFITWLGLQVVWLLWLIAIAFILSSAFLLQRRLIANVRESAENGEAPKSMLRLEMAVLIGGLFPPLLLLQWRRSKRQKAPQIPPSSKDTPLTEGGEENAAPEAQRALEAKAAEPAAAPKRPWLVPSLGPSYLIASYVVITLFVLGEWLKPVVAWALGLASDDFVWNSLLFGKRLSGGLLISMRGLDAFAFGFTSFVWTMVWLFAGITVRLILSRALMTQGASEEEIRHSPLIWWRSWFGMRGLIKVDETFKRWAWWAFMALMVTGTISIILYALGGLPLTPQTVVVGLLTVLGWFLHLKLVGDRSADVEEVEEKKAELVVAVPGWNAVVAGLQASHGLKALAGTRRNDVGRRRIASASEVADSGMSPILLQELEALSGQRFEPTHMQVTVMRRLFGTQNISDAVVAPQGETGIGSSEIRSHAAERSQLYVASAEGSGKSTLAMLAAMNHVLVHAQSVLIVASSTSDASALAKSMRTQIASSPLRWTIQVRLADDDLIQEAIDGTVPDIIICDLKWLTLSYLSQEPQLSRFTESLGFVIVDDADAYQGAQAVHAQLSFSRLNLCLSRSLAAQSAQRMSGGATSMLVLSSVLEEGFLAAAESLVKRDLELLSFQEPEPSEADKLGVHQFFDLDDFVDSRGEPLLFQELVNACENAEVPWTYWRAGATKEDRPRLRHRFPVPPRLQRENPLQSAVVFVEGRFTHVEREFARLRFAGIDFLAQAIEGERVVTFIRMVDRDEQMAFDVRDGGGTLSALIRRLPMSLVHVPGRTVSESHLTAELIHREMELEEVLECFGEPSLRRIRQLAKRGRITVESRTLLASGGQSFQEAIYVKARARAVYDESAGLTNIQGIPLLAPRPTQVRHTIDKPVRLFDRVNLTTLDEVDPLVASFRFFPFSVYNKSGEQWLVMERVGDAGMQNYRDDVRGGDVVLEPYSEDWVAVPERRLRFVARERFVAEPIQFGELPIRVARLAVQVQGDHVGTRYVDPDFFLVHQRRQLPPDVANGAYRPDDDTDALVVNVASLWRDVDEDLHEPLRALFISALRMSIGLAYSSDDHGIDVALMAKDLDDEQEWLSFFELSVGGSGSIRALARDGLENLLRLTRLIVERVLNHDRLIARYNDRPMIGVTEETPAPVKADPFADVHSDDGEDGTVPIFRDASADEKRALEKKLREILLEWLDARLMPETGADVFEEGRAYPSGFEMGEKAASDLGRAWVAATLGVSDLRWTRLHWFAPRGDERREADVGISRELIVEMIGRRKQLTPEYIALKLREIELRNAARNKKQISEQAEASLSASLDAGTPLSDELDEATPSSTWEVDADGARELSGDSAEIQTLADEATIPLKQPRRRGGFCRWLRGLFGKKTSQQSKDQDGELSDLTQSGATMTEWPRTTGYMQGSLAVLHGFQEQEERAAPLNSDAVWRMIALQLSAGRLLEDAVPMVESLADLIDKNLRQMAKKNPLGMGLVDATDMALADTLMLASALVAQRAEANVPPLPEPIQALSLDNPMLGVHHGETNVLTAAMVVALFHSYWGRPAGFFINEATGEVLAALHLPSTDTRGASNAFEQLGRWRETMLLQAAASPHARRRIRSQRAVTYTLPRNEGIMVGVDLMASRTLTALTETQRGPWVFLPLHSPLEVKS